MHKVNGLSIWVVLIYNIADKFFVGMLHDNTQAAAAPTEKPLALIGTELAKESRSA